MKRRRISVLIEYGYYMLIPIALVGIINIIAIHSKKPINVSVTVWLALAFLSILCVAFYLIRYLIRTNPKVKFDQTTLYYGQNEVKLKSVSSLKMTTTYFMNRHKIKICFIDAKGENSSFTFYPRILYLNIQDLIRTIEAQNPNAKLQKLFKGPFLIEKFKN